MNFISLSYAHFILLIYILKEIYGTRIPLEIVQLETGTRLSDDQIANSEYQLYDINHSHEFNKHNKSVERISDNGHVNDDHSKERFRDDRKLTTNKNIQEPRIFYQIGTSEDDLPICGVNEVCSKIDLYKTPWIERQCRCPPLKHYRTFKSSIHLNNEKNSVLNARNRHAFIHNLKLDEITGSAYQFESEHFKNFLMKLGLLHNIDDNLMNDDDDYAGDSDSDRLNYDEFDEDLVHLHGNAKSRRRTLDDISVVKTTKIRHHNNGFGSHSMRTNLCSNTVTGNDGYTIADKTRLYKMCEPIQKLPLCRYFRDYTWTLISYSDINITQQIVHCRCPKNSISYLIKREPLKTGALGYTYLFACSPQSRLKCQRKEPCKLFTVRKRQEQIDEVNTNALCQCPRDYRCPKLHTDAGVILGKSYIEDNIRTYSGYCMQEN